MSFKGFLYLCWGCMLFSFTGFYLANWKYVPEKAQVKFFVQEKNGEEAGVFTGIKGAVSFNPAEPEKGSITAEIAVKTINTGIDMRDESLRSKDFFEADKYPVIRYVTDSVSVADSGYIAHGKLTLKNTTKSQQIPFRFVQNAEKSEAVFSGSFTINRLDFGVGSKDDGVGTQVRIVLEIPVQKQ